MQKQGKAVETGGDESIAIIRASPAAGMHHEAVRTQPVQLH